MVLFRRDLCVVLVLCSVVVVGRSDWVKVPLQTRQPQFDSFEREAPTLISDKMETFVLPFRVESKNRTKQMDIDLEDSRTIRRKDERITRRPEKDSNAAQVTKKRISEPFSIFGFLRSFRDSFFFKPQASVKEKVGFLERIRNNILSEISM